MSDIYFVCPTCNGPLVVDDGGVGMDLPCPHCHTSIIIPSQETAKKTEEEPKELPPAIEKEKDSPVDSPFKIVETPHTPKTPNPPREQSPRPSPQTELPFQKRSTKNIDQLAAIAQGRSHIGAPFLDKGGLVAFACPVCTRPLWSNRKDINNTIDCQYCESAITVPDPTTGKESKIIKSSLPDLGEKTLLPKAKPTLQKNNGKQNIDFINSLTSSASPDFRSLKEAKPQDTFSSDRNRWAVLAGIFIFGLIFAWVLHHFLAGKQLPLLTEKNNSIATSNLPKTEKLLYTQEASQLEKQARTFLKNYFQIASAQKRLEKCRGGIKNKEVLLAKMRNQHSRYGLPWAKDIRITRSRTATINHAKFIFVDFLIDDKKPWSAVIEQKEGYLLLDWEAFFGTSEMYWDVFLEEKPRQGIEARVLARKADYYMSPYASEQKYLCLKLSDIEDVKSCYGYIERGTALERSILKSLETSFANGHAKARLILKMHFEYKDQPRTYPQVKIDALIPSDEWMKITLEKP